MASQKIRYPENQIAASPTGRLSHSILVAAQYILPRPRPHCMLVGWRGMAMRLHDLARAAAAFTLAWAAFAQLPGKSHEAIRDGDPTLAWPIAAAHPPSVPAGATAGGARP